MNRIDFVFYRIMRAFILWFKPTAVINRNVFVVFVHIVLSIWGNYLAFVIRFESLLFPDYFRLFLSYLPILLVIRVIFYFQARLNKDFWRYSSIFDMIRIVKCVAIGSFMFFIVIRYVIGDLSYPLSIYVFDCLLLILFSCGTRVIVRIAHKEHLRSRLSGKRVLIVGDSNISETIIKDMNNNPEYGYIPIGLIDEDIKKKGRSVHGVSIFGPNNMIPEVIEKNKPDEILISAISSDNKNIRKIFELSKSCNIPIKKLPGMKEILNSDSSDQKKIGEQLVTDNLVSKAQIDEALSLEGGGEKLGAKLVNLGYITKEDLMSFLFKYNGITNLQTISLEDLIQREPVRTGIKSVSNFIEGKPVIVTGAGGSIGSELCRQIIKYNPSNLILFDRYENGLFKIDLELKQLVNNKKENSGQNIVSIIGDILETSTLDSVFSKHKPQIIFHAAAHKHVPLMEDNPLEAVKNNVFGTKNVVDAADRYKAESFVLVSTDKAVNPTSIMGATKRIAELLTISMNSVSLTKFTTVRFGNVLGSNGSVVPVFTDMLKSGGPLEVTHPEIKRYFMLIPEAVNLVLIAAASESTENNSAIFVLDMGEQIKIVDLAENLIRLSGFIPHEEIKIAFTCLRPGEKLYEELFDESERVVQSFHKHIRKAIGPIPSMGDINRAIARLKHIVKNNSAVYLMPEIQRIIQSVKNQDRAPEPPSQKNKVCEERERNLIETK